MSQRNSYKTYNTGKLASVITALAVLAILPLVTASSYWIHLLVLAFIGAILAMGLNIFMGYCGQINFGAAGFYAVGAYGLVLIESHIVNNFWVAGLLCLIIASLLSWLIGKVLLRLRGHTLALGTAAFGLAIYECLNYFSSVTGGENGLPVTPLIILGNKMQPLFYYYFILGIAVLVYWTIKVLMSSHIGRAMKMIRSDEITAKAMGINTNGYISMAWVLSNLLIALGGILFAQQGNWINEASFSLSASILILTMVVFGGLGSNIGAAVGGGIVMLMPQFLGGFQEFHGLAYGIIILLVLLFFPQGLAGLAKRALAIVSTGRHKLYGSIISRRSA